MTFDACSDRRRKDPVDYPADAAEFSGAESNRLTSFFEGLLEGYSESLATWWKEPFLLAVESNLILDGFDGEAILTRQFDSPEEFKVPGILAATAVVLD